MTLGRPRFVRAVGTDSAGLVECDPLAYDRVELRQFQTVRRVAADACQGRFDADAVDGLHSFDTDGQRDVTAERGNPVPLGLQVRVEASACFPMRVGYTVAR